MLPVQHHEADSQSYRLAGEQSCAPILDLPGSQKHESRQISCSVHVAQNCNYKFDRILIYAFGSYVCLCGKNDKLMYLSEFF